MNSTCVRPLGRIRRTLPVRAGASRNLPRHHRHTDDAALHRRHARRDRAGDRATADRPDGQARRDRFGRVVALRRPCGLHGRARTRPGWQPDGLIPLRVARIGSRDTYRSPTPCDGSSEEVAQRRSRDPPRSVATSRLLFQRERRTAPQGACVDQKMLELREQQRINVRRRQASGSGASRPESAGSRRGRAPRRRLRAGQVSGPCRDCPK